MRFSSPLAHLRVLVVSTSPLWGTCTRELEDWFESIISVHTVDEIECTPREAVDAMLDKELDMRYLYVFPFDPRAGVGELLRDFELEKKCIDEMLDNCGSNDEWDDLFDTFTSLEHANAKKYQRGCEKLVGSRIFLQPFHLSDWFRTPDSPYICISDVSGRDPPPRWIDDRRHVRTVHHMYLMTPSVCQLLLDSREDVANALGLASALAPGDAAIDAFYDAVLGAAAQALQAH